VVEDNATPGYTPNATDRYITTYSGGRLSSTASPASPFWLRPWSATTPEFVYLNGREVFRSPNLPAAPTKHHLPYGDHRRIGIEDTIDNFTLSPTNLVVGTNVFAVEIHQQARTVPTSASISSCWAPDIIHNLSPTVELTAPTKQLFALLRRALRWRRTAADAEWERGEVEYFADGVRCGIDQHGITRAHGLPRRWDHIP